MTASVDLDQWIEGEEHFGMWLLSQACAEGPICHQFVPHNMDKAIYPNITRTPRAQYDASILLVEWTRVFSGSQVDYLLLQ